MTSIDPRQRRILEIKDKMLQLEKELKRYTDAIDFDRADCRDEGNYDPDTRMLKGIVSRKKEEIDSLRRELYKLDSLKKPVNQSKLGRIKQDMSIVMKKGIKSTAYVSPEEE